MNFFHIIEQMLRVLGILEYPLPAFLPKNLIFGIHRAFVTFSFIYVGITTLCYMILEAENLEDYADPFQSSISCYLLVINYWILVFGQITQPINHLKEILNKRE